VLVKLKQCSAFDEKVKIVEKTFLKPLRYRNYQ